jgi:hypothetical protein
MDEEWNKFKLYFIKVEKMIGSIYRSLPVDTKSQISQNEYLECNRYLRLTRLVFEMNGMEESAPLSAKIKEEFRLFILKEVASPHRVRAQAPRVPAQRAVTDEGTEEVLGELLSLQEMGFQTLPPPQQKNPQRVTK